MDIKYLKVVLEHELYQAIFSLRDLSKYAQKEEAEKYIKENVIEPINTVLKDFDIIT